MALSNAQLWDYCRDKFPNFKSQTAKATAELFTAKGFEQLAQFDSSILNDFFYLSLRVFLQKINVADVKDLLSDQDFGESYDQPYGGYTQRIAINSIKPVSPAYKGLKDGDSPDPFIVRKPETNERFFTANFDYQSVITLPDNDLYKNMFVSENGMSEYMAGIMKGLQNGYILQKYNNKLEALNAGINSVTFPLKASQQYECADLTSSETIIAFIKLVRDLTDAMVFNPATSMFNAYGFESTQEKSRLRLLVKPQLLNTIATISKLNSPEDMTLPLKTVRVPNFGGLTPTLAVGNTYNATFTGTAGGTTYTDKKVTVTVATTASTPSVAYGSLGDVKGYSLTLAGSESNLTVKDGEDTLSSPTGTLSFAENAITFKDPNEDIIAIIADKGYIFENIQNPYVVEPARNPRGRYTSFWASSPNNGIVVDHLYNIVVIRVASGS